ncbi:MAG: glycosyltransferase family 4 protein [Bacteroidales bacterium]
MRILQVIPGSGGSFYCGNCLRDSKYVDALRKTGHDVVKLPMYLPLFADEHDIREVPVFYGAISIYLKQLFPVFRHAPGWFDRLLNSKPMLKLAAGMAGSTDAKGLEEMTISMLKGEHGQQHEELDRMIRWIREHYRPDVIHLSNALLSGLAPRLRRELGLPVFCSLQDEDVWVDIMKPQFREQAWQLMRENGEYIDGFIGVSRFFSDFLRERLAIPDHKLGTIHLGIDPADYEYFETSERPLNIGFLSRMCHENGLDILIEAFILLKQKPEFEQVRLIITGGSTGADKRFLAGIRKRIRDTAVMDQVDFHADFENHGRMDFLRKVSVLSVPVRNGEAFGLYLLESMASGIPVVQPALGAFPEIIEMAGGGATYQPNSPEKLAETLAALLADPERLHELSRRGRAGVEEYFDISAQAEKLVGFYSQIHNSIKG